MARVRSILVVLAAVLAAGCGTDGDRREAQATVERLYDAIRHDDGVAACRELSTATALALAEQEQRPCGRAITRLELEGGAIVDSRVAIRNAKVDLRGGESAFLGREVTGWKVTALGCRPEGEPTERPMDCEASS